VNYFQERHSAEHYQRQLIRQLERLGHKVTWNPSRRADHATPGGACPHGIFYSVEVSLWGDAVPA